MPAHQIFDINIELVYIQDVFAPRQPLVNPWSKQTRKRVFILEKSVLRYIRFSETRIQTWEPFRIVARIAIYRYIYLFDR